MNKYHTYNPAAAVVVLDVAALIDIMHHYLLTKYKCLAYSFNFRL